MDKRCLAEGHNSDCADGESRTSIPSIHSLTLKWPFYFFLLSLGLYNVPMKSRNNVIDDII